MRNWVFPTPRHEEWKYTNIAPLLKHKFKLAQEPALVAKAALAKFVFDGLPQNRVVLVNGRFVKELSQVEPRAKGLVMESLSSLLQRGDGRHEIRFGQRQKVIGKFVALKFMPN